MRQLPNNKEIEESLIASMLIDDSIIPQVTETLNEKDFYHLWFLFSACLNVWASFNKLDILLLKEKYEDVKEFQLMWWFTYILEIIEHLPTSANWELYRDKIIELSARRKIVKNAMEIMKVWFDWENIQEVVHKVQGIWQHIFDIRLEDTKVNQQEYLYSFSDFKDEVIKRNWMLWDSWPYKELDKYHRGIIKGKVYTIAWFSNIGKSKFTYSYIRHFLEQGKKVLYFSLEVDKALLFANILSSYYKKPFWTILWKDFDFEPSDFKNLDIVDDIYDWKNISALIKTKAPDIVFIDFVQNVNAEWYWEYEKMTNLARDMQLTAIKTWATIFSISQVNNESRNKEWGQVMMKGSWALFASSDIVYILWKNDTSHYLTIAKNKYWKANVEFILSPNFETGQFSLMSNDFSNPQI